MSGEYTMMSVGAAVAVVLIELIWFQLGIFRKISFWVSLAIVFGFQILVDGWLTKLTAPIVIYRPSAFSGRRFPWDVPLEDFAFGFALVTLTILLWERGRKLDSR